MTPVWNLVIELGIVGGFIFCLFLTLRILLRWWFRNRSKSKDQRISFSGLLEESGRVLAVLGVLVLVLGNFVAHELYQKVFIPLLVDQPVAYKTIDQKFEMHRRGTHLGSKDHVDFYFWGPRDSEDDFDDWQAVAEMKIQQPDLIFCLPQLARAASSHGYDRVVLLPNKNLAFVVDSQERIFNLEPPERTDDTGY
jgi:hypothetical protein